MAVHVLYWRLFIRTDQSTRFLLYGWICFSVSMVTLPISFVTQNEHPLTAYVIHPQKTFLLYTVSSSNKASLKQELPLWGGQYTISSSNKASLKQELPLWGGQYTVFSFNKASLKQELPLWGWGQFSGILLCQLHLKSGLKWGMAFVGRGLLRGELL